MDAAISPRKLRAALREIEQAEQNGFMHCLGVFKITSAGVMLDECRASYSDLLERAHPTDPSKNWGRFQAVTKRNRYENGKLVKLKANAGNQR